MHDARVAVVLDPRRAGAEGQRLGEARPEVIEYTLGLAQPPDAKPLDERPDDDRQREGEDEIHDHRVGDVDEDFALRGGLIGGAREFECGDAAEDREGDEQRTKRRAEPRAPARGVTVSGRKGGGVGALEKAHPAANPRAGSG